MSELMAASNQWANRPADQRFASLEAIHAAVTHHRSVAAEARSVPMSALTISTQEYQRDGQPPVVEPVLKSANSNRIARFTNFAFGQFAKRVGAPAAYLRSLPAGLAASNLNYGLRAADDRDATDNTILFAQNGELVTRAITSDSYTRIWNVDITSRLIRLAEESKIWQPAPAAFDGSRGLYASDKDMFCFLVDNDRRIFESMPGGGLSRGFFVSNSEVGDASFRLTTFLYQYVCGNHIVWGAQGVTELRIPHVGDADERAFRRMGVELRKYAETSAKGEEAKIERMMKFTLGNTKDEVLDRVFGLKVPKRLAAQAYDLAVREEDAYGNPRSVWGFTSGMTQIARDLPYTDERVEMERLAGKVMQIAF
jgi:hypothetical protein